MESIKQLAQRALRERINGAEIVKTPDDYTANYPINRMQRDYTNMLGMKREWCNWSGPGAGKTNGALLFGRTYNCRNMVIICPNSVKKTWVDAVNEVFNVNSRIINVTNIDDVEVFDRRVFNYIIINYDKFSISSRNGGKNMVDALLDNNEIDFICFDEAHCVKKTGSNMTKRRQVIEYLRTKWETMNPDKYISGMTATPTTTSISEARSMIELVTGKKYDDIKDDRGIINILQCHKGLINNGTRYKFDPGIEVKNTPIYIDGSSILNEIRACRKNKSNVMEVEKLLTELKMNDPNVLKEIKRDTIIFSYYCDNNNNGAILNIIKDKVAELGFTYAVFSGGNSDKREQGLKEFIRGEKDILIATQPIVSGIDGLQKRSNRMLMIGYPWTNEKSEQLSGRIVRQRSNFNIVHIINTIVNIKMKNGKNWSWDLYKINKIQERRNLQDMLLDGKFHHIGETKGGNESEREMANKLLDRLEKGMTASDYTPNRDSIEIPEITSSIQSRNYHYGESVLNDMHRLANTTNHTNLHQKFEENPESLYEYHKVREENKKTWPTDPAVVVGEKINKSFQSKNRTIVDMGCGTCTLKATVKNQKVMCIDHQPIVDGVIKADAANLKGIIKNESVDAVVHCLSLWGPESSRVDYFNEDYRILKPGCRLYIVEPAKSYDKDTLIDMVCSCGFELREYNEVNDGMHTFMYIEFNKLI